MANDIKQKIVLEGEKEYNRALSEAKRNLKTLRSELKAETAELGNNATAQQKNEARAKSLQKQIKEQEKIVKTYQEALKEVKTNYADNEEAIAKWEQKLNDSRTALANMKNELDKVGQGFKDVQGNADMATVATKSVADSLGKLSDIGGAISESIENAFSGMLTTVKSAINQIWSDILDIAAKSDNYMDLASFLGASAEDVQKWDSAMKSTKGDLSTVTNLISRLKYGGKAEKVTEWFGVSDVNYENDLEYFQAVMEKMSKMKKEMSDGTWDKAMAEIFGAKKVQDVDGVLSDWEDIVDGLNRFDPKKGGFGLTEEEIKDMATLSVQVATLQESWQKLKEIGEVKLFGKLSMDLTGNAQAIVDAMLKYMNAGSDDERDEALKSIEKNITAMFETAKAAIMSGVKALGKVAEDLKNSDNPTAKALGNILSGLVDALKWLTEDNMNNVVKALEILAGFWLTGKGLQMGTKILEIVQNINAIKAFKLISSGADIASGAATAGSAAGASFGAAFLKAFVAAAPALASILGITGVAVAPAIAAQADAEKKVEERRERRLEASNSLENSSDAQFLQQMADALGLKRDSNGNLVKNVFGQNWIGGNEAEIERLLMGMGDRSDLQKAQLYNILKETYTGAGYSTWEELQRMWGGEGLDMSRMTALLEAIADAYSLGGPSSDWWKTNGGNSGNSEGLTSGDAKDMTGAVKQMPREVAKAIGGIRVYMNGTVVGQLVADEVSRQIAAQIV